MVEKQRSPADDGDVLYGVAAIARFLGIPEKACRHRVEKGEVPSFLIGGTRCGRRSTVNAWLADQEAAAREARRKASGPEV